MQEFNKVCWIALSYTRPSFRKLGLFKYLYSKLKILAKDKNMTKVSGGIANENEVMKQVAISTRRYIEY